MARVLLGVAMLAALLAPSSSARPAAVPPPNSYSYRILNAPTSSDERAIRTQGLIPTAQRRSDKLYGTLSSLLGGSAPRLNFVPTGSSLLSDGDASANYKDFPGAPAGTVNVSPLAVEAMINDGSPYHDSGVTLFPHEYAHLHQTPQTLASVMQREGGAQAFADAVTPTAAQQAGIPYTPGHYDPAVYAPYVQTVQQSPYGQPWIMGGQFGKTAPPAWP